jgi:ankyrin repeat protein
VLKLLLDRGATEKINTQTADGITPIQAATWDNRLETLKTLVSYGALFDENIFRYTRKPEVSTYFKLLYNSPPSRWGSDQWEAYVSLFTAKNKPPIDRKNLLENIRKNPISNDVDCLKAVSTALAGAGKEKVEEYIEQMDLDLKQKQLNLADTIEKLHTNSFFDKILSWLPF